jgi:putative transposase
MPIPRVFRYFKTSPEIIRLAVMMYVRYPPSLQNVEDLLHEREIDISHEAVRLWWNRFGVIFAAEIRRNRAQAMRHFQHQFVFPSLPMRIHCGHCFGGLRWSQSGTLASGFLSSANSPASLMFICPR